MHREIESKFDVLLDSVPEDLVDRVKLLAESQGWTKIGDRIEKLQFQYYDTVDLLAYQKGETIRQISGFEADAHPKGIYRYDFNTGSTENRLEKNHWSSQLYSPSELVSVMGLEKYYPQIVPSALADTNHWKLYLQKGGTKVEVTFDFYRVRDGQDFKELELELESGSQADWQDLSELVKNELNLKSIETQKYSRIIEGMPLYIERHK